MEIKYFTVEEAAQRIGVHTKTVRRYIYSGKIKALKIGGQWRISEEDLNDYLNTGSCKQGCDEEVNSDDFCVFMDGSAFDSEDTFQICSIVDYYIGRESLLKEISADLMEIVASQDTSSSSKFNYVYDKAEQKARFVLWGSPSFMESVMNKLKTYDNKK